MIPQTDFDTSQRLAELYGRAEAVCDRLRDEVVTVGLERNLVNPQVEEADYSLSRDPASGKDSLVGIWRDARGQKLGEMVFHADGSFFAEYDVICPHPKDMRWFVEAVTAWGRDNDIRTELRLLPAV